MLVDMGKTALMAFVSISAMELNAPSAKFVFKELVVIPIAIIKLAHLVRIVRMGNVCLMY